MRGMVACCAAYNARVAKSIGKNSGLVYSLDQRADGIYVVCQRRSHSALTTSMDADLQPPNQENRQPSFCTIDDSTEEWFIPLEIAEAMTRNAIVLSLVDGVVVVQPIRHIGEQLRFRLGLRLLIVEDGFELLPGQVVRLAPASDHVFGHICDPSSVDEDGVHAEYKLEAIIQGDVF